jgi:hypothetical protein
MKNIVSIAIVGSVICVSGMSAHTICPKEIGSSDLQYLQKKEPVTINSIELKNRGEIYLDLFGKSKAVFKDNDFTGNKDEELCTYAIEGEKKSFTLMARGTLPESQEEVRKKPSLLPKALSREP